MTNLADKTALVTGANRGIGRATALALAAAGARVIVHFGRNADEAKRVVDQIRAADGRTDAVSTDLAAPDGAHMLAAQVRNLIGDRLDIFVSNAGISNAQGLRQPIRRQCSRPLLPRAAAPANSE
jgi:3-oxoacyl-[acyl-carrier protein] reductase